MQRPLQTQEREWQSREKILKEQVVALENENATLRRKQTTSSLQFRDELRNYQERVRELEEKLIASNEEFRRWRRSHGDAMGDFDQGAAFSSQTSLNDENDQLRRRLDESDSIKREYEHIIDVLKTQNVDREETISSLYGLLDSAHGALRQQEVTIIELQEGINHHLHTIDRLESTIDSSNEFNEQITGLLSSNLSALSGARTVIETNLQQIAELESENNDLRARLDSRSEELASVRDKLDEVHEENNDLRAQRAFIKADVMAANHSIDALRAQLASLKVTLDSKTAELKHANDKLVSKAKTIAKQEAEIKENKNNYSQKAAKLDAIKKKNKKEYNERAAQLDQDLHNNKEDYKKRLEAAKAAHTEAVKKLNDELEAKIKEITRLKHSYPSMLRLSWRRFVNNPYGRLPVPPRVSPYV